MQHEDSCRALRSHRHELDGRVYCCLCTCCLCTLGLLVTFPPDSRSDLRCARQVVRLSNANPAINSGIASCGFNARTAVSVSRDSQTPGFRLGERSEPLTGLVAQEMKDFILKDSLRKPRSDRLHVE
jgi:hypothetical protein